MPTITPATVPVGLSQHGKNAAERAVLRICSPMQVGKSLIKRGEGDWYCKQAPSQRELDGAVTYFLGGHIYDITDALYAEIVASVGPECLPIVLAADPGPEPDLGNSLLLESGQPLELESGDLLELETEP